MGIKLRRVGVSDKTKQYARLFVRQPSRLHIAGTEEESYHIAYHNHI